MLAFIDLEERVLPSHPLRTIKRLAGEAAKRDMAPKLLDEAKERSFHPKTLDGDEGYDNTVEGMKPRA
jgi:hypothetical protein